MLTNLEKADFINQALEDTFINGNGEEVQRMVIDFLKSNTNNGKVYKYRTFNKYAIRNLKEGTLYCSVPSSFNDPFDCQTGIDIQSLLEAIYGKEFKQVEEYMRKFIQVFYGAVSLKSCTDEEMRIFNGWLKVEKLCKFLVKYKEVKLSDEELGKMILNNMDIVADIIIDSSSNDEFKNQMKVVKEYFPRVLQDMAPDREVLFLDEDATYTDFAQALGIDEDTDEISLIRLMYQKYYPKKTETVKALDELFTNVNQQIRKGMDSTFRVGCLCDDYKNRLMWSHYANSHKGFCIEYDFGAVCKEVDNIAILPVIYSKERLKFPWKYAFELTTGDKDSRKAIEIFRELFLALLMKDDVWSYENEWRIITPSAIDTGNIKMPPISCIYIGTDCAPRNKARLINMAKELKVPVKQMVLDRGTYALHAQDC